MSPGGEAKTGDREPKTVPGDLGWECPACPPHQQCLSCHHRLVAGCWPLGTERLGSREAYGPLCGLSVPEQCDFRVQGGGAGTTPPEHPFSGAPRPSNPPSLMGPCLLRWEVASGDTPSPQHPFPPPS